MDVPDSMKTELGDWNGGTGIDLESWIGCEGNFKLAVGYSAIFWPSFVEFDGYILRAGFAVDALRGFEVQTEGDRASVEAVMNHLHIADIQCYGCADLTVDKAVHLGTVLKDIYEAKLRWQFPDRPCRVSFYAPTDETDLIGYEVTFWQVANERAAKIVDSSL